MNMRKILITMPAPKGQGGVVSLFETLVLNKESYIDYFHFHKKNEKNKLYRNIDFILNCLRFIKVVRSYDVVHVNPTMDFKCFFRDSYFILIAKFFNKKTIVYWHGWHETVENKIKSNYLLERIFIRTFGSVDLVVVLGIIFEKKLRALGTKAKIVIESNTANNNFQSPLKPKELFNKNKINILFISRIEKEKGIYIAFETLKYLRKKNEVQLLIVGIGNELVNAKKYVEINSFKNVQFLGYLTNQSKHECLSNADIMFFPSFNEGMPIVLLEAMLYGLPIVSRNVGGIPDWIINGENGFLTDSKDPECFAEIIDRILNDEHLYKMISENNIKKYYDYFSPEKVSKRLISYYDFV